MSVIPMRPRPVKRHRYKREANRVYAIAFDIDTAAAEKICGTSYRACYEKIQRVLSEYGFNRVQGSVFFGDQTSDAVKCVMAVQELDRRYAWFGRVIRDLRMLRVDEDNDLLPALSNRLRLDGDEEVA